MCFGVACCQWTGSVKRWPFVLRPLSLGSTTWILDYGAECEGPPDPINIVEKVIEKGEYFGVGDDGFPSTYRVTEILELR